MSYSLASKSGEMLTSRDVRDSVPTYMPSVPKYIPYGAKFSRSTIFADFADGFSTAKSALRETLWDRLIIRIFI